MNKMINMKKEKKPGKVVISDIHRSFEKMRYVCCHCRYLGFVGDLNVCEDSQPIVDEFVEFELSPGSIRKIERTSYKPTYLLIDCPQCEERCGLIIVCETIEGTGYFDWRMMLG